MTDFPGRFPATRSRRFRAAGWRRALVRETVLSPQDFVLPLFVKDGSGVREPVTTLPGVDRLPIDIAVETAREARDAGIPAVALFPATDPALKTADGAEALNSNNLVCRTVRALKAAVPDIGVICDVALDPYTDHGHDGLLVDAQVANDATVEILVKQALVLAEAGCDMVAPSDMMDGRIGAIRAALEDAGHADTLILSYAAKYASALYGPFRDAVGSSGALQGASKATYQMDPANRREALREVALDIGEGADAIMVKPALAYLDVIGDISAEFPVPVFGYHVSGEYGMVMAGAAAGLFDARTVMLEHLTAIKRAGASAILTYAALDLAEYLNARSPSDRSS